MWPTKNSRGRIREQDPRGVHAVALLLVVSLMMLAVEETDAAGLNFVAAGTIAVGSRPNSVTVSDLDQDGFLYITGRKKNSIVLGSGKIVQPEEVETAITESPNIAEACVVGRRVGGADAVTEIICAVVAPTEAARARHAEVPAQLETAIEAEVTACIQILAAYKRPTRILLAPKYLPNAWCNVRCLQFKLSQRSTMSSGS